MQLVHLTLGIADFSCTTYQPCTSDVTDPEATFCAVPNTAVLINVECLDTNNEKPALDILVDYGDGSGSSTWTRENPINVFKHTYSSPGTYNVFIMSIDNLITHMCNFIMFV